jgi:hypothetical protein
MMMKQFKFIFIIGSISLVLSGCLKDEASRKGLPRISDFTLTSDDPVAEVTPTPIPDATRPTNQIFITNDFCACLEGEANILNNCTNFCASRPASETTSLSAFLFVNTTLGVDIVNNESLGNLQNWCTVELAGEPTKPDCKLQLTDPAGTIQLLNVSFGSNNSFKSEITNIETNVTFVASLIETQSGAVSQSFQFRRINSDDDPIIEGLLKIMPITQYTCISRSGSTDSFGSDNFDLAIRTHFYFPENNEPAPLPPISNFLFCHDIEFHNTLTDSAIYDRLEEVPGQFLLWDQSDVRFFDLDGLGGLDVNQYVKNRLQVDFGLTNFTTDVFSEFRYPNRPPNQVTDATPDTQGPASDNTPPLSGFFLIPWINPDDGSIFCPNDSDLNGEQAQFRVLSELIGPTEGIYMGEKETEVFADGSVSPQDIILIREGLLRSIWFYIQNEQHIEANDLTSTQRTIHFYWPPDISFPRIKKSYQKRYTVRYPSEIGAQDGRFENRQQFTPPDKRFGCVPSLGTPITWP